MLEEKKEYNVEELLAKIAAGNQDAFALLVDRYWKKIYNQALLYSKSIHRAEEITQDIFVKIWAKRHLLAEVNDFDNYLYILCRNQIISALRRNLGQATDINLSEFSAPSLHPGEQYELKDTSNHIFKIIEQLPPARKKIFMMSRVDGLSYDEIAAHLNISKNTVKRQIVIALSYLRFKLSQK